MKNYLSNINLSFFILNLFIFAASKTLAGNIGAQLVNTIDEKINAAEKLGDARQKSRLGVIKSQVSSLSLVLDKQLAECKESKQDTDTHCLERNSKEWNGFMSMLGSMSDMTGMAMTASCSKLANLLHMGQAAQAAFRTNCGIQKNSCVDKCTAAEKTLSSITLQYNALGREIPKIPQPENYEYANNKCSPDEDNYSFGTVSFSSLQECQNALKALKDKVESYESLTDSFSSGNSIINEALAETDSPTALKRLCIATQQEVTAKVGMNLMTLMSAVQKNQACAKSLSNDLADLGEMGCVLNGTCPDKGLNVDDCADPKYKDSIYCQAPPTLNSPTGKGFAGGSTPIPPTGGPPDFNLDSKALSDLDLSGAGNGLDPNDPNSPFNKIGDTQGPRSAGVPGGGGEIGRAHV